MYSNGFLKVAAASPKSRLGDPFYNVNEIIKVLASTKSEDPAIICFPELCISGYSVGDLLFQDYLYKETNDAIQILLDNNPYLGIIIFGSYIILNDTLYNCSFIVQGKEILGIVPKTFLPHTHEFYESRWFLSSQNIIHEVFTVNFLNQDVPFGKLLFKDCEKDITFGTEVCADIWAPNSPNELLYSNGALMVFNCSASPSQIGKKERRRLLTKSSSYKFNSAYIYTSNNASESTSECVFSGHLLIAENGNIISEDDKITLDSKIVYADIDIQKLHFLRRNNSYYKIVQDNNRDTDFQIINVNFNENNNYIFSRDFDKLPFVPKTDEDFADVINIQSISLLKRLDYVRTNISIIGISGGLDSTLALLALCYAYDIANLDRKNIHAISMPSKETSNHTFNNAKQLATKLGVTYLEIPINEDVIRQLNILNRDLNSKDTTYENVQARFRTYTLMNYANANKGIVIGTSDMSEIALGWSTFNGDHMAMYGLNSGLTKTALIATVMYYKSIFPYLADLIDSIVNTPISPELTSKDQKTEDIIGKYEINDFILYHFLVYGADNERLMFLLKHVFNLSEEEASKYITNFNNRFYSQQFKRLTSPEGVKILDISLSPRTHIRINGDIYRSLK